jgi:hypothetical protein
MKRPRKVPENTERGPDQPNAVEVLAHSLDLAAAQALGLKSGHIGRPGEGGPGTGETEPWLVRRGRQRSSNPSLSIALHWQR